MSAMKFHMIPGGPRPVAPFSHAVETDGFVFVTGQMPDTPDAPGVLPDGIVAQTSAVMENLKVVLAGLKLGLEHVVMARIYLTHFKQDYADERDLPQLLPLRSPARPHLRRRDRTCL
jgi:enamine deaminase RidA (YjgF/YER057c/UK114 family)